MKVFFCFGCLLLMTATAFSQVEGRTIKWKASSVTDVLTGSRTDHFKEVISRPGQVDFISQNGQLAASLAITSRNGNWNDQATDGSTTVKVEAGAQKGQVIFKRVGGRLMVTLLLMESESRAIFDIDCSGFEVINP
ncbi:MAG: hypothetical protein ACKOE6_04410 [Flammeovirgaceae bacterium]